MHKDRSWQERNNHSLLVHVRVIYEYTEKTKNDGRSSVELVIMIQKLKSSISQMDSTLGVKHKTIKVLEDNMGVKLDEFGSDNYVLEIAPKVQSFKEITDECTSLKLKTSSLQRQCKENEKTNPDWKKLLAKGTSDKELYVKIYKKYLKFNMKYRGESFNSIKIMCLEKVQLLLI